MNVLKPTASHVMMIQQIDKNFNLHASKVADQHPGMRVHRSDNLTYVDSGLSCDTFNIIHITDGDKLLFTDLEKALMYFKERKLEYCIWVSQENLQTTTKEYLQSLSVAKQNEEVGMILDLETYLPVQEEENQKVKLVTNKNLLSEYAQVIAKNWTPPDQNVLNYYELTAEQYLDRNNQISLLTYYHEGKAVSTVELFPTDNEIIGLYGFATLESYRGLGIGSSLMRFSLNLAKKMAYEKVILHASKDGIGIYRRYGFKEQTGYYEYA